MTDKKDFRIDILKVKRKLFSMYPENSQGRKALLREETLKEYMQLNTALNLYPKETKDHLIVTSQLAIKLSAFRIVFAAVGAMLFGCLFFLPIGWVLKALTSFCFGSAIVVVIFNTRSIYQVLKAINQFTVVENELKDKMNKLQEKLRKMI